MKRLMAVALCLVVGAEVLAMFLPDRRFVLWISGIAVALALVGVRRYLVHKTEPAGAGPAFNDPEELLRRWLSRTETLIQWSESTRSDWDKHLRPMLARQFEMATGQKKSKDPIAFEATGQILLGDELWRWVDPENIARSGGHEPGPGRSALDEILQRLEQV